MGEEVCQEKVVDNVVDVPEEMCDLVPVKTCNLVTKLLPKLTPTQECSSVPKQFCHFKFRVPRSNEIMYNEWC